MNRLDQLKQFYDDDPGDPLNLYLLALEYRNTDPAVSSGLLLELISRHPEYLPAYYTTAEILYAANRNDEAYEIIDKGISLARKKAEQKALSELMNLKSELEAG